MDRLSGGDTRQFTMTMSVSPDGFPTLSIYNNSGAGVSSLTSTQSGATYDYFAFYTCPETPGIYYAEWNISVSSKSYVDRELFEIILTDANQSGLYSDPNDLRTIHPKIDTLKLTNREFLPFISDADNYINLRLSNRYSVPFATGVHSLPPMITYLSKNIALFEVLTKPSRVGKGEIPGWLEARQDKVEAILKGLEVGSYSLVTSGGGSVGISTGTSLVWGSKQDYHPVFTLLDETRQRVDSDYIDELEDDISDD